MSPVVPCTALILGSGKYPTENTVHSLLFCKGNDHVPHMSRVLGRGAPMVRSVSTAKIHSQGLKKQSCRDGVEQTPKHT